MEKGNALDPNTWLDEYGDYLFRFAVMKLKDAALAEDMVQDTLLSAMAANDSFSSVASVRTWLTAIIKNKMVDHWRRQGREASAADLMDATLEDANLDDFFDMAGRWAEMPNPYPNPDSALASKQFWSIFEHCLSRLKPQQAEVFVAKEIHGMDNEEICEHHSLSASNVWVLMHRARVTKRGWVTPRRNSKGQGQAGGRPFSRGHLYRILSNPIYIGRVAHKELTYAGQHPAIIDEVLWNQVQTQLVDHRSGHKTRGTAKEPGLLAGLVFDDEGERLTSVHSKRVGINKCNHLGDSDKQEPHARCYRYYLSQKLIRESRAQAPYALRVPAQELEQVVIAKLHHFLSDGMEIWKILEQQGLFGGQVVHAILGMARSMADALEIARSAATSSDIITILHKVIDRIVVRRHEVEITLKLGIVFEEAKAASGVWPEAWASPHWDTFRHTVVMPIQIKRSGYAHKIIVEASPHEIKRAVDAGMVKLLSKAHHWFSRLTSGEEISIQQISEQAGISRSYVSKILYLAFLAPDIVKTILRGRHPSSLTVEKLMGSVPLPIDWDEQRKLLGFR